MAAQPFLFEPPFFILFTEPGSLIVRRIGHS